MPPERGNYEQNVTIKKGASSTEMSCQKNSHSQIKSVNKKYIFTIFVFSLLAKISHAQTTLLRANVYDVPYSADFVIGTSGSSDFVFNWQNQGAVVTQGIHDPTLILAVGSTYTFQRSYWFAHPFVVLDVGNDAAFTGTDGAFYRTVYDPGSLSTLFTTYYGQIVSWTPTVTGDYFYTCAVGSHGSMAGLLTVVTSVPEPATLTFTAILLLFVLLYRRFYSAKKETGSAGG